MSTDVPGGSEGAGEPRGGRYARDSVGSVAEEAAKLFGALSDLARERGPDLGSAMSGLAGQAAHLAHDVEEHLATGSAECRYCPLCRTVNAVRHTSPEVRAHLAAAAGSLVQAAAGLLTAVPPEGGGVRGSSVERIDLEDAGGWPGDEAADQAGDAAEDKAGDRA